MSEIQRARRVNNPEVAASRRENAKTWQLANADAVLANRAEWRAKNREKIRSANKRLYDTDVERSRTRARADYWRHAEKRRARALEFARLNPEKVRVHAEARRAREANAGGRGVSFPEWRQILNGSLGLCAYCQRPSRLTLDHIDPLARGGAHDPDNVVGACRSCNSSKNDALLVIWLARRRQAVAC